jgi:hypothetical protein
MICRCLRSVDVRRVLPVNQSHYLHTCRPRGRATAVPHGPTAAAAAEVNRCTELWPRSFRLNLTNVSQKLNRDQIIHRPIKLWRSDIRANSLQFDWLIRDYISVHLLTDTGGTWPWCPSLPDETESRCLRYLKYNYLFIIWQQHLWPELYVITLCLFGCKALKWISKCIDNIRQHRFYAIKYNHTLPIWCERMQHSFIGRMIWPGYRATEFCANKLLCRFHLHHMTTWRALQSNGRDESSADRTD